MNVFALFQRPAVAPRNAERVVEKAVYSRSRRAARATAAAYTNTTARLIAAAPIDDDAKAEMLKTLIISPALREGLGV